MLLTACCFFLELGISFPLCFTVFPLSCRFSELDDGESLFRIDDINRCQSVAGADQPKSNAVCSKGALESEFSTLREFSNEDRNLQHYIRGFIYIKALFLIRIKFSCSNMSDSFLHSNGLQHARPLSITKS